MTVIVEAAALTGAEPTLAQAIAAVRAYADLVQSLTGPTSDASVAAIAAATDAAAALASVLTNLTAAQTARSDAQAAAAQAGTERQAAQAAASGITANVTLAQKWATQTGAEVVPGQGFGAKKYSTDAATSATSAAGSVTLAGTKADSATASAAIATARAADAVAALAGFLDRYQGPRATPPTLRPSGAALVEGDLYDDTSTTPTVLKIYQSGNWVQAAYTPGGVLVAANNLSDLTDKAQARINLGIEKFVSRGDAAYTILPADRTVGLTTALTTARTWTLPAANSLAAGSTLRVIDLVGGISITNTLTIARAGADTINGGTSFLIAGAYADVVFVTDGTSRWVFGVVGLIRGGTGATSAAGARTNLLPAYSGNALSRLRVNAAATDVEWFAPVADLQPFTVSGTWTKQVGSTWALVELLGGGGGGQNVVGTGVSAGGGGGGGFTFALYRAADLPATVTVTVGTGGSAVPNGTSAAGGNGGTTSFGALVSALGGQGGTTSFGGAGGAGDLGAASGLAAVIGFASGGGGWNSTPGGSSTRGGGGSGGGFSGSGVTTAAGTSRQAGNGGAGNSVAGQRAVDGAAPGGGGGGSTGDGGSGAGGAGRADIKSW